MPDHIPFVANPIDTGEIHLWQLPLSGGQQAPESWLDQDELTRFQRFSAPGQARRYLLSRCAMRQILSTYLSINPQDLNLSIQRGGKPVIASPDCDLQFNLSHTGDIGLLAVARRMAVGVDIEKIRPISHKHGIARRVFDPDEVSSIMETARQKQDGHFFQLWTCMEARQKCKGQGVFGNKVSKESVGMHEFTPSPGYCAAVAWDNPSIHPILQFSHYSRD